MVLEGRMECDLGRGWCRLGVGQAWACGSLEAHPWRVLSRNLVEFRHKYRTPVTPGEAFVDLIQLLDVLGKAVAPSRVPQTPPWSDPADIGRIRAALELIEQSQGKRISATEAARVCHMSRSTFDRTFKRMTGFSYAHFAFRSRIAQAARLLKFDDAAIKTVARSLGFTDSSHFHHAFVAQYGVTPAQYRAACFDEDRTM